MPHRPMGQTARADCAAYHRVHRAPAARPPFRRRAAGIRGRCPSGACGHTQYADRARDPDYRRPQCQRHIGDGNTVALAEPNVIVEAADLDLATIEFPDLDRDPARTSKNYFPLDRWPPRRARKGEAVTIVGFPGQERRAFETSALLSPCR